jgi:hypothetical protein
VTFGKKIGFGSFHGNELNRVDSLQAVLYPQ